MNWRVVNPDLHFERQPRRVPHRAIAIGVGLTIFTLLWRLIPSGVLYWLLLPLVAGLVWAASYGWRQTLAALITLLAKLEQL